jgi:hypothetical protein
MIARPGLPYPFSTMRVGWSVITTRSPVGPVNVGALTRGIGVSEPSWVAVGHRSQLLRTHEVGYM